MRALPEVLPSTTGLLLSLCLLVPNALGNGNLKDGAGVGKPSPANQLVHAQSVAGLPADILRRELRTIDDRPQRLVDYAGKIIVVNLFASWCIPCRMTLADLIQLKERYQGLEVIGVVNPKDDPDVASLRTFALNQKINFPVVWDDGGFGESLIKSIKARSVLPQTLVIDKGNRIVRHFQGFNGSYTPRLLREAIDELQQKDSKQSSRFCQKQNNCCPIMNS